MDVEGRNSEIENLVARDYNVGKDSIIETTMKDVPI